MSRQIILRFRRLISIPKISVESGKVPGPGAFSPYSSIQSFLLLHYLYTPAMLTRSLHPSEAGCACLADGHTGGGGVHKSPKEGRQSLLNYHHPLLPRFHLTRRPSTRTYPRPTPPYLWAFLLALLDDRSRDVAVSRWRFSHKPLKLTSPLRSTLCRDHICSMTCAYHHYNT